MVWAHVADLPAGLPPDRSAIIDAERGLPYHDGTVGNREFLSLLAAAGYDGPVTAEPLADCVELFGQPAGVVAHRVKGALDACWPSIGPG